MVQFFFMTARRHFGGTSPLMGDPLSSYSSPSFNLLLPSVLVYSMLYRLPYALRRAP